MNRLLAILTAVFAAGFVAEAHADYTCSTTVRGMIFRSSHPYEDIARREVLDECTRYNRHDLDRCVQGLVCRYENPYNGGDQERRLLTIADPMQFIREIQRRPLNGCTIGNGNSRTTYRWYILRHGRSIDIGADSPAEAMDKMKRAIRQGLCRR